MTTSVRKYSHVRFPDYELSAYAKSEFMRTPDAACKADYIIRSSRAWIIFHEGVPVCMVGVWRLSMVGSATRVWFVGFRGFERAYVRVVRFLRRGLQRLRCVCGPLSLTVDIGNRTTRRFVEFLGFCPSGEPFLENGVTYRYYFVR